MSIVRSGGAIIETIQTAPVRRPAMQMYGDMRLDYAAIWKTQPSVRTVVSFLGRNIAQLGLHVYQRVSDTDRQRVTNSPMADLVSRPYPGLTWYRLADSLVQDVAIYDEAFLIKARAADNRIGLLRVPPGKVEVRGLNGFRVGAGSKARDFDPDEVIYFRGYNPEDQNRGFSPMETLRRILAEDSAAAEHREHFWRNAARIEGFLQRPADAPEWSDVARARFLEEWQALYSGAGNAGRTAVLEEGMTFKEGSFSAKDSQYIESRKLSREEAAAAYHVPLPMVGILDHATFSNIREQHKQLYQDTLGPWLQMIQQELAVQLLPDVEPDAGLYVEFNLAEKLKGSFEEQAASIASTVGGPVMTRNEGRARLNLPAIEGGDELITPLNVSTASEPPADDSTPEGE